MAEPAGNNQVSSRPTECPVILHLSDLHFGNDENPQIQDDRRAAMECLADRMDSLDGSWHPRYVCITGDIGYRGKHGDYVVAAEWLQSFLARFSVPPTSVFMCPGNHDVFRPLAEKHGRPGCADEADTMLSVPLSGHFDEVFSEYRAFQETLHIPKYAVGSGAEGLSYLYGVRQPDSELRFICVNSCWYSKNEEDSQKLYIGLPLLRSLLSRHLISERPQSQTIDIALIHHPKEYLADCERNPRGGRRPAAFDFLAKMSHVILTGHTHADLRPWDQNEHEAYVCGGGASWVSISHPNAFRLIQIDKDNELFHYKSFQWNALASKWQDVLPDKNSRFFQNKLERDLAERCQPQRATARSMVPIQVPEPEGHGVEPLCDTPIQVSNSRAVLPANAAELHDRPIEADLIVRELIRKIHNYNTNGDYHKTLACWEENSGWFAAKRPQINAELADELILCVDEARLYLERT